MGPRMGAIDAPAWMGGGRGNSIFWIKAPETGRGPVAPKKEFILALLQIRPNIPRFPTWISS